ncbi:hypothetical protein I3842_01G169500 [Carya illinoinensis]|uniref:NAC domain-containing protein n=1 Tax=Carya illinoinensis TaxID=32201 RepID=A0A922G4L8_CARIL|nr:hypothetical protein I3842_01G169500 [Carya illinoinensis]
MSRHWYTSFPIGFRFDPKDEVLVSFYLWRKKQGLDLPKGPIVEADVYAHEPWFLHQSQYLETWKANTGDMEIKDSEDHLVGYMKSLTFFKCKNKERIRKEATKTDWTMHEYRLASDSQSTVITHALLLFPLYFQSWTLCRIRYRGHDHVQHGPRTDPSTSEQAFLDTRIPDFPSSEQAANFSNYQYRINYKHFRDEYGVLG